MRTPRRLPARLAVVLGLRGLGLALGLAIPLAVAVPQASAGPSVAKDAALAQALRTRRVRNVAFEKASLADVVKWLRVATGFNFHVKLAVLAKASVDVEALEFNVTLEDVTVATLLDTLLVPHGLAVKVEGNVVFVTTKGDASGKPLMRLYGIAHITYTKIDFIAPPMDLRPSDYTPTEEYVPEVVVENDPLTSGDAVVELIKEIVAPGEWDTEGWSIRATDTYLVVRAPRWVQNEVNHALDVIAALK